MGILLRNWHLKLSAVLLATVLYTGLVFSGSFSDHEIEIRVEQDNTTRDMFVLSGDLGLVTVRYRVETEESAAVAADAFSASVDLSEYDLERAPEPQQLPVQVTAIDGIQILSVEPSSVRVQIDNVGVRSVPVDVDPGRVPRGLEIEDPEVSADEVEIRGPESVIARVDRAVALITIDASGINFDEPVELTLVDVEGQPIGVGQVDIDPRTVAVRVEVRAVETETTVPVRPVFEDGTPAAGFALEAITVDPFSVTLAGLPEVLSEITVITTEALSIAGASADQTFEAELDLPDGVRLADGDEPVVTVTATIVPSVSSRTFLVGVVCIGSGQNACLPQLDRLSVTLTGPGGALGSLGADDLTPVLDASGLAPGTYSLTPALPGLPAGVELLGVSPGSVPVTIEAPAPATTPTPAP